MEQERDDATKLREVLFGASQALYIVAAVLRDREMSDTSRSLSDLAEMLSDYSVAREPSA